MGRVRDDRPMPPKPVKGPTKPRKGLRRTRLKRVSDKQKILNREYLSKRKGFLDDFPRCLFHAPDSEPCLKMATDIHHQAGRGPNLLNESTWLPICRDHHSWIHSNGREARKLGYLK